MLNKTWVKKLDIQSPNLLLFLNKCIKVIPVDFKKAVASTSGKYHPFFARLEGGLLHGHTRYGLMFVNHLCEYYQFTQYEKEQTIIAMFLHDSFKGGRASGKWGHTVRDHAVIAYEEFSKIPLDDIRLMDGTILNGKEAKENILAAIRFHMGQWSSPKSEIPLALQSRWTNRYVLITQTADYLSSKQDIPEFILGLHEERVKIEKADEVKALQSRTVKRELF